MMRFLFDYNFDKKTAIVRVDYNVPLGVGENIIFDPTKLVTTIPTINKILNDGGRVVLMSHLGRPKRAYDPKLSLEPIAQYLEKILGREVKFSTLDDLPSENNASVTLLENLRFYPGEEGNDREFAKKLARWGDVYVNDAFATIHRNHASTTLLPKLFQDRVIGLLMHKELENANRILKNPKKPLALIIGGSKVADKLKSIERLMPLVDYLILGGGAANTFLKAKELEMGRSIVEDDLLERVQDLLYFYEKKVKIILPVDVVVVGLETNMETSWPFVVDTHFVEEDQTILDIGPKSRDLFARVIGEASTILWSGPMGLFENEAFRMGTSAVAEAVDSSVSRSGAFALVGGGDTSNAINLLNKKMSATVSTGGSALLEYIANQKLQSLLALE